MMRKRVSPSCLKSGRRRGFTLLEVLACLMLAAVVLPVAMRAISQSTRGGSHAKSLALATNLAESKLAEIVADQSWASGDAAGEFSEEQDGKAAERFSWTLEVDDWLGTTVKELRLIVNWEQMGREQSVSLATAVMVETF